MSEVTTSAPGRRAVDETGGATRALLWLLGGLALAVLAVVATAPELLGDLSTLGGLVLLAAAAGLPGLVVVVVVAIRRRGEGDDESAAADHGREADEAPHGGTR